MRFQKIIFLITLLAFATVSFSFAKEQPQPNFKITGYIEKINADSISVFVPRMKKSMLLILAKNIMVTDFANSSKGKPYSMQDLKEKDMAVFEGIISQAGFVCQAISFVHSL